MSADKAAAIAYRNENGKLLVALVTARSDGRWVLPKGSIEPGESAHEAAARETVEEAGVIVDPTMIPIGRFTIQRTNRRTTFCVYAMRVIAVLDHWAEADVRERCWATPRDAAKMVREPELQRILHGLENDVQLAA